ncbi:protein containing Bacterial transglutaminase-like protein [Candidatus Magnetomorum sp. HK-1]|nr:protein containing Bacterial transglutaminase-like protein [Candidatus Magnetomorum sp. HK-1]
MRYKLVHNTSYEYSEQAALSQNELCLFPRNTFTQTCEKITIKISPTPSILDQLTDYFGNHVHHFMIKHPHDKLEIEAESIMQTFPYENTMQTSSTPWEFVKNQIHAHQNFNDLEAYQFVFPSDFIDLSPVFAEYAKISFYQERPVIEACLDLTERIFNDFAYTKGATIIDTPLMDVFENKKGVCQDFAHFQIACLRSIGLAAKYVSGYLETLPPPGKPKLVGVDASHAWISVYVPDLGWIDFDPTNNVIPGERHITVAWGRDYGDVTPVKGLIWGGGTHKLSVHVDMMALNG